MFLAKYFSKSWNIKGTDLWNSHELKLWGMDQINLEIFLVVLVNVVAGRSILKESMFAIWNYCIDTEPSYRNESYESVSR